MKERIKGLTLGLVLGATIAGGTVLAATGTQTIEVIYDNIKVYKDNVLCSLKDANGSSIEPFIYNGTTYLPVRGTAGLADMEVSWDGATKSVYLWDELVPEGTYMMDVCPPYQTDKFKIVTAENRESFKMAGKDYTNGIRIKSGCDSGFALFNLDSKYSEMEFVVGHIDGSNMEDQKLYFYLDGELVKELEVKATDLPKTIMLPVSYALQLKIVYESGRTTGWDAYLGIGNMQIH